MAKPPSDRIIIEGFRGVAKSFIACAYCVWLLWRNRDLKVMIVSASKDRADANAIFIKKIIQSLDFLTHLLPDKGQRDTQNLFDIGGCKPDASPSVKSVGITGQITGSRADVLIADDVEVTNNSGTQVQRNKLNEAVREFDAILKPKGQIIYLGTPQNEMSLYNELELRGYVAIIFPILYPNGYDERQVYGNRLASLLSDRYDNETDKWKGRPTDPQRFDEEEIDKRKLSYGKAGFALQFMLNTSLSDYEKYPLKVSDLIVTDLDLNESSLVWSWCNERSYRHQELPCVALKDDYFYAPLTRSKEMGNYQGTVMTIDPSGRGTDLTAYTIMKYLNGYLYVVDVGGFKEGYEDSVMRALAVKAKFFNVNVCVVEPNFGNGMFRQLLIPVMKEIYPECGVEDGKTAKSQKEARIIDTLEPVMMKHKLIMDKRIIEDDYKVYEKDINHSLIYQLTRLTKDRGSIAHDDKIESLAMAVEYWLDVMSIHEQQGKDDLEADQYEKWLDPDIGVIFIEEPFGNRSIYGNVKNNPSRYL